jgi:hypothetical protein
MERPATGFETACNPVSPRHGRYVARTPQRSEGSRRAGPRELVRGFDPGNKWHGNGTVSSRRGVVCAPAATFVTPHSETLAP